MTSNSPQLNITGKGNPFIWLHGLLNSVEADSIYSLIDFSKLAEFVSVIRYDYCDKSTEGNYSWPDLTEELNRIIDSQNYDKLLLGGLSMGAGTILHFATRFPEKVKALILFTPPPGWEMRTETIAVYKKIVARTNHLQIPQILKRIVLWSQDPPDFFEQKHPGTKVKLQQCRLNFEPQYYSQIYRGGAESDFPSREQISQLNVPTLIVSIPNDSTHPEEMAQTLHHLIKNSEMEVISNYSDYEILQKKVHDFIIKIDNDYKS